MKTIVQISLDLTNIPEAIETAHLAVRAGVDWLEAGTPLIIAEGMNGVRALRAEFPVVPIVADLKTMDGGWLEAEIMARAGATHVVVMERAHPETIKVVVKAGRDFGVGVMGDNLGAPDMVASARRLEDLGCDFVIHHIGYDERRGIVAAGGRCPSPLDQLAEIVAAVGVPVQAVGGLTVEQAVRTPEFGAPLVVLGAPLTIDADAFKTAGGDLESKLRRVCERVHAYGEIAIGGKKKGPLMSEKMTALVNYSAQPHSVELREIPVPEIGDEDVLLAVQAVGICGSDLHQYIGKHSWKVNYPVVLGHEFAGIVAKRGKKVRAFKEGDRVVSETAAVIDTSSPYSRQGLYNLDPSRLGFGYGVNGAMTRFVKVPERCLHRLPDSLSIEKAALTEPCCVAYNATCVNSRLRPGDTVAVIGPGPIGLLCALMAKIAGAGHLAVIGIPADVHRLDTARQLGADTVLGGKDENIPEWVKSFGDGFGFDLVIDAAGVSATLKLALDIVRPAGQITKVGWGPQPLNFSLDPLVAKAITLQGSFSHNWPIWEKVISLLGSGKLNLDPILNRVSPLENWHEAFEEMHAGKIVKGVLRP